MNLKYFFPTTESESGSDEDEDGRRGRLIDDSAEPGPVGSTEGDGIHMTPAEAREARGSQYLRGANIFEILKFINGKIISYQ